MTEKELKNYLKTNFAQENEAVEWKAWTGNFNIDGKPKDDLGSYVSAIANENGGFLIIGVEDKTLEILGIKTKKLSAEVCLEILRKTYPEIKIEIEEKITSHTKRKVWIVKIPKHPVGQIVSFHKPYQRSNSSLIELTESRRQEIQNETKSKYDWSAQICKGATIEDLDKQAIEKAKKQAIEKATGRKKEILESCQADLDFLDKARITKNGQITNAAMILLGKEESAFDLIPYGQSLEIIWVDMLTGQKREGGKFYPPFILSVDDLASQIRISKHDYMERIGGMPTTNRKFVPQYELKSIREALHNCIAHQDYQDNKRVVLEEYTDKLYFKNGGYSKISDKEYEKMITDTFTPEDYRNEFLAKAMDTINMIERLGSGQKSIFDYARKVFLPLPDRISDIPKNMFEYTIYGSKIDEAFAQILQDRKDLDIGMILLLDRVQKHAKGIADKQINRDQHKILKENRLVEGRYPKLYLSAEMAELVGNIDNYLANKAIEDRNWFKQEIIRFIQLKNKLKVNVARKDIAQHLDKYISPEVKPTPRERINFIRRMINELSAENKIRAEGKTNWIFLE